MGEAKRKTESGMQIIKTSETSVQVSWEEFRKAQIPEGTDDRIVNACKYSFYVGAVSMFNAVITGIEKDKEAGLSHSPHVEALSKEVEQFIEEFNIESLKNSARGSRH